MDTSIEKLGTQILGFGMIMLLLVSPLSLAQEIEGNAGTTRMDAEAATGSNRFVLTPHKRNYFLLSYADDPDDDAFRELLDDDDAELDNTETEFQVSIKVALDRDTFYEGDAIQFGFTIKSFWQTFNEDESSHLRETNYQHEIWYRTRIYRNSFGRETMM